MEVKKRWLELFGVSGAYSRTQAPCALDITSLVAENYMTTGSMITTQLNSEHRLCTFSTELF